MYNSPVMTVKEASEYLKISPDTAYILVRSHSFPAIKVGTQWRVLKDELDLWLKKQLEDKPELIEQWLKF